jgi:hypothetical protein
LESFVALEAEVAEQARRHLRPTVVVLHRPFRRGVAGALSLALLGVSIALPVLDAREASGIASIEAAHDPGHCSSRHDHAACSQLASSHAVPAGSSSSPCIGQEVQKAGSILQKALRAFAPNTSSLPRAPPSIA